MPKQKIILKGIPASPGEIFGKVKIIKSPRDILKIKRGEIIVSSFLTPDFVPFIKKNFRIGGIITDKGGVTCHVAIIARELKIPYIASVRIATKRLKNNAIININGREGIVYEA